MEELPHLDKVRGRRRDKGGNPIEVLVVNLSIVRDVVSVAASNGRQVEQLGLYCGRDPRTVGKGGESEVVVDEHGSVIPEDGRAVVEERLHVALGRVAREDQPEALGRDDDVVQGLVITGDPIPGVAADELGVDGGGYPGLGEVAPHAVEGSLGGVDEGGGCDPPPEEGNYGFRRPGPEDQDGRAGKADAAHDELAL